MKRLLLLAALALTACGIQAPARDNAQWTSTVQGVEITWRATAPGGLGQIKDGPVVGHAANLPGGVFCVIDLDLAQARHELVRVAAHEVGHCFQFRYLLPGIPRPDLGSYTASGAEGFAETYARAYLTACGDSLRPLGMIDLRAPSCDEAPDPRAVAATYQTSPERLRQP